jgi:hypothetical protein
MIGALCAVCFKSSELLHTGMLSDQLIFFSVTACKDRWRDIRIVFILHLHDKTLSGSSAIEKHHDTMQFMIPHMTKNTHQENNLAASEEDIQHSLEKTKLTLR